MLRLRLRLRLLWEAMVGDEGVAVQCSGNAVRWCVRPLLMRQQCGDRRGGGASARVLWGIIVADYRADFLLSSGWGVAGTVAVAAAA